MDSLFPVAVGAALTIAGGLLGAWIQAAREHRKWLREKRLEVYLPAAAFLTEYELRMQAYADIESRIDGVIGPDTPEEERLRQQRTLEPYAARADEYRDRVAAEMTPLIVLGPEPVAQAARRWEEAARTTTGNPYVIGEEFAPVLREMRKALRIPE
ncbi:hypothetical protein ACQUSX_15855 [Microbacterium sp. YY-02]|uniref:hypothetical protein n=1 Tax=Microbacterium sp. YY-02 TaxID=3421635 RepID=UPI003D16D802